MTQLEIEPTGHAYNLTAGKHIWDFGPDSLYRYAPVALGPESKAVPLTLPLMR